MLAHHFAGARKRDRKAHNERMEQAYITAKLPLLSKFPQLKDYLVELDDRPALKAPKPWEQQMAAVRQIMSRRK